MAVKLRHRIFIQKSDFDYGCNVYRKYKSPKGNGLIPAEYISVHCRKKTENNRLSYSRIFLRV